MGKNNDKDDDKKEEGSIAGNIIGAAAVAAVALVLYAGPNIIDSIFGKTKDKDIIISQESEQDEEIILIIGRTGAGKSTLANVLVGKEQKFEVVAGSVSGTQKSQHEIFEWKGTNYRVIDTIGHGNVAKLSDGEIKKDLNKLKDIIEKGRLKQILFVLKDRFTKAQIESFKWLKNNINVNELLYPYITIVPTNFPGFEDEEICKEDKRRLRELEKNKDLIEIIDKCKMIHVDCPPLEYGKVAEQRWEKSRKIY